MKRKRNKKLTENSNLKNDIEVFITGFGKRENTSEINNLTVQYFDKFLSRSPSVFYETFLDFFSRVEDEDSLISATMMLSHFLYSFSLIPGKGKQEFFSMIIKREELGQIVWKKFRTYPYFLFRSNVLNLYNIEGFFFPLHKEELRNFIITQEPLLLNHFLRIIREEDFFSDYCSHIINKGNRYALWGLIDFFLETIDPLGDIYFPFLADSKDIVVKLRLRAFEIKRRIYTKKFEEGRIDDNPDEEREMIQVHLFDITHFISLAYNSETGTIRSLDELDNLVFILWNQS